MLTPIEQEVLKTLQNTPYQEQDKFCGLSKEELTPIVRRLKKFGFIRAVFTYEVGLVRAEIKYEGKKYLKLNYPAE